MVRNNYDARHNYCTTRSNSMFAGSMCLRQGFEADMGMVLRYNFAKQITQDERLVD